MIRFDEHVGSENDYSVARALRHTSGVVRSRGIVLDPWI